MPKSSGVAANMPDSKTDKTPRKRKAGATPSGVIRLYRPEDREAVRDICRRTAYRNKGHAAVFEDGELFADYWTRYYTDYEPESLFVVEENGEVLGYLMGCMDSRRHERIMGWKIVPSVLLRALWKLATFRYRNETSRRMIYWLVTRGWREAPEIATERFPAHYHCNVLRKGYGKNYYSALVLRFLDEMDRRGVPGLHGQIEEAAEGGPWRQMVDRFIEAEGKEPDLEQISHKTSTFQNYVLGVDKPMVNRAWGAGTDEYREWITWTGKTFRL